MHRHKRPQGGRGGRLSEHAGWMEMTGRRHGPAGTAGGFGPGGWGGRGFGGHRRRMRRGDVRAALLVLLAEEPQTGYGLMGEIEQRSGGAWRPSPGSVYPTLQQLEDEGLVTSGEGEGRQPYELTPRAAATSRNIATSWASPGRSWPRNRRGAHGAARPHRASSAPPQSKSELPATTLQVAAQRLLEETRRGLYRILAGDDERAE